jgi:hypothetical protein
MTIPANQVPYSKWVGNGSVATYDYQFKITDEADLLVTTTDTNSLVTTLVLNVGYTVTGVGNVAGGSITLLGGNLANLFVILITDNLATSQPTPFGNQSSFFASTHEDSFDRVTRLVRKAINSLAEAVTSIGRTIRLNDQDAYTDLTLPYAASRANKILTFGGSGELLMSSTIAGSVLFNQATIGANLWPQTTQEAAVSVTPTYFYYEPGDVRRYGAVTGEAATVTSSVNTAAIQAALNSNNEVWFQKGVYMTGTVVPKSDQIINLNGATLKLLAGSQFYSPVVSMAPQATRTDMPYFPWFRNGVTTLNNVILKNGYIDGNVANNLAPAINAAQNGGTANADSANGGMMGIDVANGTTSIKLENLNISNCFTDGLSISHKQNGVSGDRPSLLHATDCVFDTNARQGMSIVNGSNFKFSRCRFINTNKVGSVAQVAGIQGGAHTGAGGKTYNTSGGPWAGVDVEPFTDVFDLGFVDCEWSGNSGKGMILDIGGSHEVGRSTFDGCTFFDNATVLGSGDGDVDLSVSCRSGAELEVNWANCFIKKKFHVNGYTPLLANVRLNLSNCQIGDGTESQPIRFRKLGAGTVINLTGCHVNGLFNGSGSGATLDMGTSSGAVVEITGGSWVNSGTGVGILCVRQAAETTTTAAYAIGISNIAVVDVTNFVDGDVIGIKQDGGEYHWTQVSGTPVVTSTPAGTIQLRDPLTVATLTGADVYRNIELNTLNIAGTHFTGGSNALLNTGSWDVHVGGGSVFESFTQNAVWNYQNDKSSFARTFVGDAVFKNCFMAIRSQGSNSQLQVLGAAYEDCGEAKTTISAAEQAAQTILSVASSTGLVPGEAVGIAMDNGRKHWTYVAAVPDGVSITLAVALPYRAGLGATVYIQQHTDGVTETSTLQGAKSDPGLAGLGTHAGLGSTYQSTATKSATTGGIWVKTGTGDTGWTIL